MRKWLPVPVRATQVDIIDSLDDQSFSVLLQRDRPLLELRNVDFHADYRSDVRCVLINASALSRFHVRSGFGHDLVPRSENLTDLPYKRRDKDHFSDRSNSEPIRSLGAFEAILGQGHG